MGKIVYNRGTTYVVTHNYTGPVIGVTLYFTVKTVEFDSDATDTATAVLTPKNVTMSGTTFPQQTIITITPTDVADTVDPGDYFYDIKVLDSSGSVYLCDSGTFTLNATPTNRE